MAPFNKEEIEEGKRFKAWIKEHPCSDVPELTKEQRLRIDKRIEGIINKFNRR